MASEWQKYRLNDIAEVIDSLHKSPSYSDHGYSMVRVTDIRPGFLSLNDTFKVTLSVFDEFTKKYKPKKGDIVFSRVGSYGVSSYVSTDEPFCLGQNTVVINPKIDGRFLYLTLQSAPVKHQIESVTVGTTQKTISLKSIKNIEILCPDVEEQKAIAHILGSLDDKIELNRQMNATLEAMAQALFKSWFVDFDPVIDNALAAGNPIPDELEAKAAARQALGDARKPLPENIRTLFPNAFVFTEEMGWIPEGWNIGEVGGILDRLTIKKRYKKNDVLQHGKIPVYEQGANILLGYHQGQAEIESDIENPAFIFGDHTCVTKLSCEPFSISENVIPLRGKKYPTAWVYFAIQDKQNFEEYRRHWMELIVKTTILPEYKPTQCFVENINGFLQKQIAIVRENSSLEQLRDTLLPKLLSGELRIPEAEQLVEETI